MTSAEKYVTAAYLVVLAVVLLYIVIYAFKLSRLERELGALVEGSEQRRDASGDGEAAGDSEARLTRQ